MKNTRLSLILSIIAIVGVLSVWALWIFGSLQVSVVDLGSFVGVIVALLAIIVTIILGWQIINAVEIRAKIKELEKNHRSIQESARLLNDSNQNFIKLAYNLQAGICDGNTDSYITKGLFVEAFGSCHSALHQAIIAGQSNLKNRIEQLNKLSGAISSPPKVDFFLFCKQIEFESQRIKETEAYRLYLSADYDQIMDLFWKKMIYLGVMK